MTRTFTCALTLLLASWPQFARASDEGESLALLVETLEAVDDPGVRSALMRGMLSGLEGRRSVTAPRGWSELRKKLAGSADERVRDLSMQLSQIFGDLEAIQRALAIVQDTSADTGARRKALRSLLTQRNEDASSLLESLLDEPALCLDAIRGYAMVENASAPTVLLGRCAQMSPELRRAEGHDSISPMLSRNNTATGCSCATFMNTPS